MGVLSGIRVLDLSSSIAPSVVAMLLSDYGADVIKVERPAGDPTRTHPGFAMWNRGKRSVVCSPTTPKDTAWLSASMSGADICVLDPQAETALPDPVREAMDSNARLVAVHLPPYLDGGAPWQGGHESNSLLAASIGLAWRQSSEDGDPVEIVDPHLLYIQGIWGATCAVAALIERYRSGQGQKVTVTGVNAAMEAGSSVFTVDPNKPDPDTAVGSQGRHPTYRAVRAQDAWLACGALGAKFEAALMEELGLSDVLNGPRLKGRTQNLVLPENMVWSRDLVAEAFRKRPREYWLERLTARGIPNGPLLHREEWLDHPVAIANGLRTEVEDPERGNVIMPTVPVTLLRTPAQTNRPAPTLGQHNGDSPWPPQPPVEGRAPLAAGPLSHLRILNLGTFVASPYAGFLLAELGADVIKVEPKTGDPFRTEAFSYNRGMRSLAIDLQTPRGVELFHEVVRGADVITDGMRPGAMVKLGLDHASLEKIKEDIVTVSLAAFGKHGELAMRGGVDMVVQAMTGMMLQQGDDDNPVGNSLPIIDVATGAVTALAAVLGVFHRDRTGEGQHTWDSLVGTATFLACGELVRFDGREPSRRGGPDFKGCAPLDRFYQANDAWVRVQAPHPVDISTNDLEAVGIRVAEISTEALGEAIAVMPSAVVAAAFNRAGVAAVVSRKISQALKDPTLRQEEFSHLRRADDGSTIASPGRYATFSRTQRSGPMTPPGIGEHSTSVLKEAGVAEDDLAEGIAEGIVVQGERAPIWLPPIYR